jgi:geranylgeranyl reductase family protein
VKEKTDVAVVGGGPCGSFSALTAARRGAGVTVFEEHEEIGVPEHCAGLLSISGLKRIPLHVPPQVIQNKVRGAVFYSPSGEELVVRRDAPVSLVINRELFDKHLADIAKQAGVQYSLKSKVKSLVFDANFARGVSVQSEGAINTVTSKVVIDAEGCSSVLLKRAGLKALNQRMVVNAIQTEASKVDGVDLDAVEVYLGRAYAPGFFAWIIPRKDASAKVGLATKKGDPREYLHRFVKHHPIASKKLKKAEIKGASLHPIPLGGMIPKASSNGLLVVGDTASQVKPTTGGGVLFGLLCSKIAGEIASEALKQTNFSDSFLSCYQLRCKALIGSELTVMLWLRKMLDRLPDKRVDKLVALARKLELNQLLEASGDMDFQGRTLMHMLHHPTGLVAAIHLILSSLMSLGPSVSTSEQG